MGKATTSPTWVDGGVNTGEYTMRRRRIERQIYNSFGKAKNLRCLDGQNGEEMKKGAAYKLKSIWNEIFSLSGL